MIRCRMAGRTSTAVALGLALALSLPGGMAGQSPPLASASGWAWPRWEDPVHTREAQTPPAPQAGGTVLLASILGAAGGSAVAARAALDVCQAADCGDDVTAWASLLLIGAAGGSLGSTLLGCASGGASGCTHRTLPLALVGGLGGVAGGLAVGSLANDGRAAWLAFSAIQGLVTAAAIR